MFLVAAALLASHAALGAPFPSGVFSSAPERRACYIRYRLVTNATIEDVANFYKAEAANAGAGLFDDTGMKFHDYRTLTFVTQPKFMFVVLDRKDGHTSASVNFKPGSGCR